MAITPPFPALQKTIQELFRDLESTNLLLKNPTIPEWAKNVANRMTQSNLMLQSFERITDNKKWDDFVVYNSPWFLPGQLDIAYSNLAIFYVLDMLESLTQIFQLVLDHSISCNGYKFKKNGTLGSYLSRFNLMFENPKYGEIIDNKFRIAIAHSHWWYEKHNFCYDHNGTTIKLDISSFLDKYHQASIANWTIVYELKKRGMSNLLTGDISLQEVLKIIAANT